MFRTVHLHSVMHIVFCTHIGRIIILSVLLHICIIESTCHCLRPQALGRLSLRSTPDVDFRLLSHKGMGLPFYCCQLTTYSRLFLVAEWQLQERLGMQGVFHVCCSRCVVWRYHSKTKLRPLSDAAVRVCCLHA